MDAAADDNDVEMPDGGRDRALALGGAAGGAAPLGLGPRDDAVVLHEDKQYYPSAEDIYGEGLRSLGVRARAPQAQTGLGAGGGLGAGAAPRPPAPRPRPGPPPGPPPLDPPQAPAPRRW